jgi:hypothetical protein
VFERFTERARLVVVYAQEEARGLGHRRIGAEHLLLGVVGVEEAILPAGLEDIRARIGKGSDGWSSQIPFTSGAKASLERAAREAVALGDTDIEPAHILLGLAEEPEAVLAAGATSERMREAAMRRRAGEPAPLPARAPIAPLGGPPPAAFDLDAAIASGDAVPVALGREPIGDLGNLRVDRQLLLAILRKDGRCAALLREHGLDEAAIRARLGG